MFAISLFFGIGILNCVYGTKYCSPDTCNYAGDCTRTSGDDVKCICYDAFYGDFCQNIKDMCLTERNVCANKSRCLTPFPGQISCDCSDKESGQDCRTKGKLAPTKIICWYNWQVIDGQQMTIVLSFENLGTIPFEIQLSTSRQLIGNIPWSDFEQSQFRRFTKNLTSVITNNGIRHRVNLKSLHAYYYVFNTTLKDLGPIIINVRVQQYSMLRMMLESELQNIFVKTHVRRSLDKSYECRPKVAFPYVTDIDNPLSVSVHRFFNIVPWVQKRCLKRITPITVQWKIFDTKLYVEYFVSSTTEELMLKIPPYGLWFINHKRMNSGLFLTVRLQLWENMEYESSTLCYLSVITNGLFPYIRGGMSRFWNVRLPFHLDGSLSRDLAIPRGADQRLSFSWSCKSEIVSQYCLPFMGTGQILLIPGSKLPADISIRYTLTVSSKDIETRTKEFSQTLVLTHIIRGMEFLSDIVCVRNCWGFEYTAGDLLHLMLECEKCPLEMHYVWNVNGIETEVDSHRYIEVIPENTDIQYDILVFGQMPNSVQHPTVCRVVLNPLSKTIGKCTITPTDGIECMTSFKVECKNFSKDWLLFVYYVDDTLLEVINSNLINIHLIKGNQLLVYFCDIGLSCREQYIPFTVTELPKPNDIEELEAFFLKYPVKQMLINGARQKAYCIIQELSKSMATDSLQMVDRVYKEIADDNITTILDLIKLIKITHNFFMSLVPIKYEDSVVLSKFFEKVDWSFQTVLDDMEYLDILEISYHKLTNTITQIMANLAYDSEDLNRDLVARDEDDSFKEDYSDFSDFDITTAERASGFHNLCKLTFKLFNKIGRIAPNFHKPREEPLQYKYGNATFKVEMFDHYGPIEFSIENKCRIMIPLETVLSLRRIYNTNELLLYGICFESNIFWWYPHAIRPSSAIFAVNVVGKSFSKDEFSLQNMTFRLHLKNVNPVNFSTIYETWGEASEEMAIYRTRLNGNAVLLVRFFTTAKSLRVLLTLNEMPTLNMIMKKGCILNTNNLNQTIILRSLCSQPGTAYMAVRVADVLHDHRVKFKFIMTSQQCNFWDTKNFDSSWVTNSCYSRTTDQAIVTFRCQVRHLSVFSGSEYPISPTPIKTAHKPLTSLPTSVPFVVTFIIIYLVLFGLLFWNKRRFESATYNLIRVRKKVDNSTKSENIILKIRTGGGHSTTANVILKFESMLGNYKVIIYQDPENPQLKSDSTCLLRLSSKKVKLPCKITISHDNGGRYPSWFLRTLQLDDHKRNMTYKFMIHRWIRKNEQICVSSDPKDHTVRILAQKRWAKTHSKSKCLKNVSKFRSSMKYYYVNWFLMQPIVGPDYYNPNSPNILERSCIWICKCGIIICIVCCYYRKTTLDNYYHYVDQEVTFLEILALCIASYMLVTIFDALFLHYVLNQNSN